MRFARITINEYKPGTIDDLSRKAQEALLPQLRQIPGFVSYQTFIAENGAVVGTAIFESRDGAEQAKRAGMDWLKQYAKDALVSSRVLICELRIDATAQAAEVHPSL